MHAPPSLARTVDTLPTWQEVVDTLLLRGGYNTTWVMIGTTLLGIAAGIIGVFALLRKRALVADALSHATLPGIALAFIVGTMLGVQGKSLPVLLLGAACSGVLGVVVIQLLHRHPRVREDSAIAIVLSGFFGAGIVLLSVVQSMRSGSQGGLARFIYGQTAAMRHEDAIVMSVIAGLALVASLALLKEFALVSFNEGFARVTGWPVTLIDMVMMGLIVLGVVAGLQAVGLILVVAMLIIPAASARFWTDRLRLLVLISAVIGGLCGYAGSATSALLPRKPAGSVIVLCGGALFVLSMLVAPRRGIMASAFRRISLRGRVARDHLLEQLHELEQRDGKGTVVASGELVDAMRRRGWTGLQTRVFLWVLRLRGLIERRDGGIGLSERGRAIGARVARNHALWERYLIEHADIAPSHVDWTVDRVEHVLRDDVVRELERAIARTEAAR